MSERYDVIIIGSGAGGLPAAPAWEATNANATADASNGMRNAWRRWFRITAQPPVDATARRRRGLGWHFAPAPGGRASGHGRIAMQANISSRRQ
jgi:hypothetical protein